MVFAERLLAKLYLGYSYGVPIEVMLHLNYKKVCALEECCMSLKCIGGFIHLERARSCLTSRCLNPSYFG